MNLENIILSEGIQGTKGQILHDPTSVRSLEESVTETESNVVAARGWAVVYWVSSLVLQEGNRSREWLHNGVWGRGGLILSHDTQVPRGLRRPKCLSDGPLHVSSLNHDKNEPEYPKTYFNAHLGSVCKYGLMG